METMGAAPKGTPVRGPAPGLAGITAHLGVTVGGAPAGMLRVEDGQVEFVPDADVSNAPAVASFAGQEVVQRMLQGRLNPVVAALQGALELSGDRELAVRVILGLQAGSPFTGQHLKREG